MASTSGQDTPTATSRLWHITELLESILLGLPAKDRVLSQNVSKQWCAVFRGSSAIKKSLFLTIGSATDAEGGDEWRFCEYNHDGTPKLDEVRCSTVSQEYGGKIAINSLILRPGVNYDSLPSLAEFEHSESGAKGRSVIILLNPQLFFSGEMASCRRMFVTQPPKEVGVLEFEFGSLWAVDPKQNRVKEGRKYQKGCKTVGDVMDKIKERLEGEEKLKILSCERFVVGLWISEENQSG